LPGKLAVQGLPGVKRRDAAVGRALDCEIPRRQDRPARAGRPAGCARCGRRGVALRRVAGRAAGAGERRCGGGPRRASPTLRQRAWAAAHRRRDSH
jgi:hypothetical protein